MKTKKLALGKKTVAHLNSDAMNAVKGGDDWSYNTCGLTDRCITNFLCDSGLPQCNCTGVCTLPCIYYPYP